MDVKSVLDHLGGYFDFVLDFARSPRRAFQRVSQPDAPDTSKADLSASVNGTLVLYAAAGVALGLVVAAAGRAVGMYDDPSALVDTARRVDADALPVAVLVGVFVLAVAFHAVVRGWHGLTRVLTRETRPYLAGPVQATINAALGFAAFFVPVVTLLIVGMLVAVGPGGELPSLWLPIAAAAGMLIPLVYHLPAALSAMHPDTTLWRALVALALPLVLWRLLAEFFVP